MAEEQKAVKKRGSKSASVVENLEAKKEEIQRIVFESAQYFDRKPVQSDEECAERLNEYFAQCYREGQIPTVEDMALALGVVPATLWDWEHGRSRTPARAEMIKRAKGILQGIDAKLVSEGKIPQVTYIFRAKNFYGMRDQQEVVLTPNTDPLGEQKDPESMRQKYLEATYNLAESAESAERAISDSLQLPERTHDEAPAQNP